jgi:beta-galactosidase
MPARSSPRQRTLARKIHRSVRRRTIPAPGYPQTETYNGMRGRNWSGGWKFHRGEAAGGENPARDDSSWRSLDLPHDWSIELPFREDSPAGTGGGFLDGGVGWYRKPFHAPAAWNGKRVYVTFDGAYKNSQVWINGVWLGERPYGYSTFEYDLTPHLKPGERNTLAVRLDNHQPNSRWYSGSGIYRNVWITVLNPVHVEWCGLFVTTPRVEKQSALARVNVKVRNHSDATKPVSLRLEIAAPGGTRAGSRTTDAVEIPAGGTFDFEVETAVSNPKLWSIEQPSLYTLRAEVISGGRTMDVYRTAFGIRTFVLDPAEGFMLNSRWMKLNGVCLHHDLGALGAAVDARAIRRQLEIMRAMGCNAVRTSHNPPDPALLDLCDRMGLLVVDEAFDTWEEAKVANDYHRFFGQWARKDIQTMVRRDRNHPCIVMYSIGNEIHDATTPRGVELTGRLYDWVREVDATRPVTHASNFNEFATEAGALLDAVGYNYHVYLYDRHHAEFPQRRMYASETSSAVRSRGVYKLPTDQNMLAGPDFHCSCYDNSVVEWGVSAEQSWKLVNGRKFLAGEFIWSGFDYLGEPTPYGWPAKSSYFGIVDTCGFPKDIYYFYQSKWTDGPMLHLLPHWNWRKGQTVPVWVYTNCEEAELFLNGVSRGVRRFESDGPLHLEWRVPFRAGVLRAVGRRGGRIVARGEVRSAGDPAAVRLSADRVRLFTGRKDLIFVTAEIVDAKGTVAPDASNLVRFQLTGPAMIAGVDNGDPICHEPYQGRERSAFHGKCLVIVRTSGKPGTIKLTAACEGLKRGSVAINVK